MVDPKTWQFSAEIYKTYLHCAAKIIKSEDKVITAYDGDRVMAVFIGERMRSRAAQAGLREFLKRPYDSWPGTNGIIKRPLGGTAFI
jgi:hypothetical protein